MPPLSRKKSHKSSVSRNRSSYRCWKMHLSSIKCWKRSTVLSNYRINSWNKSFCLASSVSPICRLCAEPSRSSSGRRFSISTSNTCLSTLISWASRALYKQKIPYICLHTVEKFSPFSLLTSTTCKTCTKITQINLSLLNCRRVSYNSALSFTTTQKHTILAYRSAIFTWTWRK